jgi:hypothetical protein
MNYILARTFRRRIIFLVVFYLVSLDCFEINAQTVFICRGNYSVAYHSKSDCRGLNNCQASIVSVSEQYAINSVQRRPCCICWKIDGGCITDDLGVYYNQISPPIPYFQPFIPRHPRLAQVEVGMYMQQKYDTRKEWIQNRINGLIFLINILFNNEKITCSKCDFQSIKLSNSNSIAKYSYSLAAADFANDYTFNSIVQSYNILENNLWREYNYYLLNPS